MDKLEWMPDNPHELKKGYVGITDPFEPRVLLARGFNDGSIATAKAILEDLKNSTIIIDNPYGKDWEVITKEMIDVMLGQLEGKNG